MSRREDAGVLSQRVPDHQYPLGDMLSYVRMVLEGCVAMRAAVRVADILSDLWELPLGSPHWSTMRLWLMRLGHYKLTRPKQQADDWVWLIDHSVQIGPQKCLVIVGVRLSQLPAAGDCLTYEDLEPIALLPGESSTKAIVHDQLEAAASVTVVPRVILDDHGSDLHGGVQLFRQAHPQTIEIYDVKHKAACLPGAGWSATCGGPSSRGRWARPSSRCSRPNWRLWCRPAKGPRPAT